MSAILFYVLSAIIIVAAGCVVLLKNPVYNALWLVVTIVSIAGIFIIAGAEFLAVVQIFVYAGGIMVLYVFLIMLINMRKPELQKRQVHYQWHIVFLVCLILMVEVWMLLVPTMLDPIGAGNAARALQDLSNTKEVGKILYTEFLLPFEVASVLLVVAMIGAILLGRKDKEKDLEDDQEDTYLSEDEEGTV
jgi:NADH-quinone oxidoreductase subunit J